MRSVFIAAFVLGACSGGGGAGGMGGGTGGASNAGGAGGAGGGAVVQGFGSIWVKQARTTFSADAVFVPAVPQGAAFVYGDHRACARQSFGACELFDCTGKALRVDAGSPGDAGTITMSFASTGEERRLEYRWGQNGYLVPLTPSGADDLITFSAGGGSLPPFTGKTLRMPGAIAVTSPSCPLDCGPFSRDAGTRVAWNGSADGGLVEAILWSSDGADNDSFLVCAAAAAGGSLFIPPAALRALNVRSRAYFAVWNSTETEFTVGGYQVHLRASLEPLGGVAQVQ